MQTQNILYNFRNVFVLQEVEKIYFEPPDEAFDRGEKNQVAKVSRCFVRVHHAGCIRDFMEIG